MILAALHNRASFENINKDFLDLKKDWDRFCSEILGGFYSEFEIPDYMGSFCGLAIQVIPVRLGTGRWPKL